MAYGRNARSERHYYRIAITLTEVWSDCAEVTKWRNDQRSRPKATRILFAVKDCASQLSSTSTECDVQLHSLALN